MFMKNGCKNGIPLRLNYHLNHVSNLGTKILKNVLKRTLLVYVVHVHYYQF